MFSSYSKQKEGHMLVQHNELTNFDAYKPFINGNSNDIELALPKRDDAFEENTTSLDDEFLFLTDYQNTIDGGVSTKKVVKKEQAPVKKKPEPVAPPLSEMEMLS